MANVEGVTVMSTIKELTEINRRCIKARRAEEARNASLLRAAKRLTEGREHISEGRLPGFFVSPGCMLDLQAAVIALRDGE